MVKDEKSFAATAASDPEYGIGDCTPELDGKQLNTKRGLKSRHTQLIAIGGTLGTGLFVGSGATLAKGGPAFIFLSYVIVSILVWMVVTALSEMGSYLPVTGGTMASYGSRYVSRSLGIAMGWLYWYSFGILIPYELTAAGLVIGYWPSDINIGVWLTVMLVLIVALNFMPIKFYGESEFWFAGTKIILILGLFLLSFVLFLGGGPHKQRLGFTYWIDPGAFNTWLVPGKAGVAAAFFGTLVSSVFPFTFGPEMLIVTAGEMSNPRYNLPRAASKFFWRLVVFYVGCVLAIGVICPSNNTDIASGDANAKSSAFVVAIVNAGIGGLPSVVNAGILLSALSAGNAFLYCTSRSLYSLAKDGAAPQIFARCNRHGVPWISVLVSALYGPLCYMNVSESGGVVFQWFVNLTNTSGLISWVCCSFVYLRFRKAYLVQGRQDDIPKKHWMQPYGAYIAIVAFTILCLINGFDVFLPSRWDVSSFFTAYIGIALFAVLYGSTRAYYWKKEPWVIPAEEVDLTTGIAEVVAVSFTPKIPTTIGGKILHWVF